MFMIFQAATCNGAGSQTCVNTVGSFKCECSQGWYIDNNANTYAPTAAQLVDPNDDCVGKFFKRAFIV